MSLWAFIQTNIERLKKGDMPERPEIHVVKLKTTIRELKKVYSISFSPLSTELFIVTLRDVSTLLQLEKEKAKSNCKSVAFAQAAHEFRNPLNGIQASLEMI